MKHRAHLPRRRHPLRVDITDCGAAGSVPGEVIGGVVGTIVGIMISF